MSGRRRGRREIRGHKTLPVEPPAQDWRTPGGGVLCGADHRGRQIKDRWPAREKRDFDSTVPAQVSAPSDPAGDEPKMSRTCPSRPATDYGNMSGTTSLESESIQERPHLASGQRREMATRRAIHR